ncbi:TonB family protein [Caulobacter sp. 1776]|uniref:TonB family protein n=1 Tax=Caulobacter sp. 1776 TaxID=3156420 RepID=UPI003397D1EF
MSAAILPILARGELALAGAIVLILCLRRPVRRTFGPLAAYALWLAAPLCLAASVLPAYAPPASVAPLVRLVASGPHIAASLKRTPDLATALVALWAIGVLVAAGGFASRQARFVRSLGRLTPSTDDPRVLRGQHRGAGPMLLGALRPRIVVPADFDERFPGPARGLVLAHETVHLRRGDAAINGLVVVLRCLAWFNPLVHIGARRLRIDQEIACDAAVLARRPDDQRLYAELLLGAALTPFSAPFGCHWPATGVHPLKERLMMLKPVSTTPLRRRVGLVLVGAIGLAGAGAVWAANPAPAGYVIAPDWAAKPTGQDMARYYPAEAAKAKLEGMAVLDCGVTVEGRLSGCSVLREGPEQAGFGQAALQLAPIFQMKPATLDGKPTAGGKVRIPIKFAIN